MPKQRKYRTPEEKLTIVKEHLVGKVPVSELAEKYNIAPSQFYTWQTELFEHGSMVFDRKKSGKGDLVRESRRIKNIEEKLSRTEAKLAQKNEVVSELMEEHLKLKKSLGEI